MSDSGRYPKDWDIRRSAVLRRDDYQCQSCGEQNTRLHVDHITPISEGGGHELNNLQALCGDCHADKHNRESCDICGLISDIVLTESKGDTAGPFYICERCFSNLDNGDGCAICGDETSGKYHLFEMDDPADSFSSDLCSDCRRNTNYRSVKTTEQYLSSRSLDSKYFVKS